MTDAQRDVLDSRRSRFTAAFALLGASVARTAGYEPDRAYSPDERERFDALSDRFVRVVEAALQLFRAYERFVEGVSGATLRDTLHTMEKIRLVGDAELWMDMRDVRNRVVHDYSPDQVQRLYADIRGPFFSELRHLSGALESQSFDLRGNSEPGQDAPDQK